MTKRQTKVAFTVNSKGQAIAYWQSPLDATNGWRRMGLDEAKFGVATGTYREVEYLTNAMIQERANIVAAAQRIIKAA